MAQNKRSPSRLVNTLSSLAGSLSAAVICSPLDVIKTRFQIQGQAMDIMKIPKKYSSLPNAISVIYKQEGATGFFKGLSATTVLIPLNYVIYFDLYEKFKKMVPECTGKENTFSCFAIPSVLSGFLTSLILCPLWVLRTRIQADIYRGVHKNDRFLFQTLKQIYQTEGLRVLYNGFSSSVIGLTHPLVQFVAYEKLKLAFEKKQRKPLSVRQIFISATLSKCILFSIIYTIVLASLLTYPHEVVRSRQQDIRGYDGARAGIIPVIRDMYKKEGMKAFYTGFGVNLVRIIPNTAVLFVVYEYLRSHLVFH